MLVRGWEGTQVQQNPNSALVEFMDLSAGVFL